MTTLVSRNPADGYRINGRVAAAAERDVALAAARAQAASVGWGRLTVAERARRLRPLPSILRESKEELARLITLEMGKPLREAREEVDDSVLEVEAFLDQVTPALEDQVVCEDEVRRDVVRLQPWGVAAVITPWNYPLEIALWGIVPSLLCGNAVLFKPSELVPLLSRRLQQMFAGLELERGVLETLVGGREVSRQLVALEQVRLIWFTGSTAVGQRIQAVAGRRLVKTVMELGGSSPALVFEDVPIDERLVRTLVNGRFYNCGQTCSATKRVMVHRRSYARLVEALADRVRGLRLGDPFEATTELSSLASRRQLQALQGQLAQTLGDGARLVCGGEPWRERRGAFLTPALVTGARSRSRLLQEEVFGPVLPVVPFASDEEAVRLANDTPYGLSAEIYSADLDRARAVASRIDAGRITINSPRLPGVQCPFGGFKSSGIGREHGRWGFEELSQLKHVMVKKSADRSAEPGDRRAPARTGAAPAPDRRAKEGRRAAHR